MRKTSVTNSLYKAARASATGRAAAKGPKPLAKREIRRKVYRKEGTVTRKLLRKFGL